MTAPQRITSDVLVDIWLDGFATGVATASTNYGGVDDASALRIADRATAAITGDPAAIEEVKREIRDRLSGGRNAGRVRDFKAFGLNGG